MVQERGQPSQPSKSTTEVLAALWAVRAALRVECGKGFLMLSEEEVEHLKTANPHRFFEV